MTINWLLKKKNTEFSSVHQKMGVVFKKLNPKSAADKASRIFHGQTEWKLYSHIYVSITQALEAPSIYLHLGLIFRLSLTKLGTLTLVPNMLFLLTRGNTISTLFLHSISLIGGRRWKLTKPRGYLLCHCRQHRHGFQFCCASLFRNLSFFLKERKCSSCHKAIQPLCLSPTPPQVDSDGLQIIRMSL